MSVNRTRKNGKKGSKKSKKDEEDGFIDRRGRPGKLSDDQKKWIRINDPAHDCKIAPFNGEDNDDSDLKEWIDGLWTVFQLDFENEIAKSDLTVDDYEEVRYCTATVLFTMFQS